MNYTAALKYTTRIHAPIAARNDNISKCAARKREVHFCINRGYLYRSARARLAWRRTLWKCMGAEGRGVWFSSRMFSFWERSPCACVMSVCIYIYTWEREGVEGPREFLYTHALAPSPSQRGESNSSRSDYNGARAHTSGRERVRSLACALP